MLISRAWITGMLMPGREPVPDDAGLSSVLTSLGLEVEGITRHGAGLQSLVVGEVAGKRPHPAADNLQLVDVFDGATTAAVVCGASNVPEVGGRIALAPVGTELPGGLQIAARTIRGIESRGMICSEAELDIGTDGDGIMVLPRQWNAGERLIDRVPGIVDTIFELGITPNRPDALGHVGVARDLAAKLGCTLAVAPLSPPSPDPDPSLVTLSAPDRCGRYFGYALQGAKVDAAPLWIRVRLHRLGLRPINSVVDITNLVLLEWGQPLHAFDRAALAEGRVDVRLAREGETMTALDGTTLQLSTDDLVIADAQRPQALAGVMGGKDSGVHGATTTLLLEGAWFSPSHVRRTARRHQLNSDSSYRFERGVDHGDGLARAIARAVQLISECTGAHVVSGHHVRGQLPATPTIVLRPDRTTRVLGMEVPSAQAKRILAALEVEVDDNDAAAWTCRPPTHRPDLTLEEDLIDEVMRHHGLADLPSVAAMPTGFGAKAATAIADPAGAWTRAQVDRLVDAFVATGLCEVVGFAFGDPHAQARVSDAVPVQVSNPMRQQQSVMRTHLLPGMLDALAINAARHGRPVRLFEVGRTYAWGQPPPGEGPTAAVDRRLPNEHLVAGVVLSGGVPVAGGARAAFDARTVAGVLLDVLARVGLHAEVRPLPEGASASMLHPGVQAGVWIGVACVGRFGAVHPDLVRAWDLPEGVDALWGELDVAMLPRPEPALVAAPPRFPATSRDLSVDAAVSVPAFAVVRALRRAARALTWEADDPPCLAIGDRTDTDVEVLEDYRGASVPQGRRALLLRLHYRAAERSVEDTEVQGIHDRIVAGALAALVASDPEIRRR